MQTGSWVDTMWASILASAGLTICSFFVFRVVTDDNQVYSHPHDASAVNTDLV